MQVVESLDHLPCPEKPAILTIGNFDGMHLGHQALLQHMNQLAKKEGLPSALVTFKNHPYTILRPNHPIPLLTSSQKKLELLKQTGLDLLLFFDFTLEFSRQSAEEFLRKIYEKLPFRSLVLGENAKIGSDRQGNSPFLHNLAHDMHFMLEYLPLEAIDKEVISSSNIRKAIQNEDLEYATRCLGRKYSILGPVLEGQGQGRHLGYPTANLSLENLCYPPFGVYIVTAKVGEKKLPAVANLGFAPTVRHDHVPLLETHLFTFSEHFYGQNLEVTFEGYLRPERVFASLEELKQAIEQDIQAAHDYFATHPL